MSPAKGPISGALSIIALVAILFSWMTCSAGCGGTPFSYSHAALETGRDIQSEGVLILRAQIREALAEECGELIDANERRACGVRVGERFVQKETGTNVSAETLDSLALGLLTWGRRIEASDANEGTPPIEVCELLLQASENVRTIVELVGADLPFEMWNCEPTEEATP